MRSSAPTLPRGLSRVSRSTLPPVAPPLLVEHPLLAHRDPTSPAAVSHGAPVSAADFLAASWSLLARLPRRPYVINLCEDRFHFAVGLAAALLARQVTLLPTCRAPESLRELGAQYRDVYILTDQHGLDVALPQMSWPGKASGSLRCVNIPWFPASQTAVIVFTSGSTGLPKPHPKTWGSLVQGAHAFARHFNLLAHSRRIVVGTVPPQHMYGLESTVMLPLQLGWALHSTRPTLPEDLRRDCAALASPAWLMTTPMHLRALEEDPSPPPGLECIISATMPLSPAVAGSLERRWGIPLYEVYGCTEGGMIAGRRPACGRRWTLCVELNLKQDHTGTRVSGGHVGAPIELPDRITVHNEREFSLHGRAGDLVKIGGKRTSLAALNLVLAKIQGVRDGVFFRPLRVKTPTTRLSAAVVAPGLTKRAILRELKRHIDPVFLPRPLYLVDSLPRTETGKVPYSRLAGVATAGFDSGGARGHG